MRLLRIISSRADMLKIAVYGLQPIEVSAQIEGWKEGGSVGIDPDENPNSSIDL